MFSGSAVINVLFCHGIDAFHFLTQVLALLTIGSQIGDLGAQSLADALRVNKVSNFSRILNQAVLQLKRSLFACARLQIIANVHI